MLKNYWKSYFILLFMKMKELANNSGKFMSSFYLMFLFAELYITPEKE